MTKLMCSLPRVAFWLVPRRPERLLLKREIAAFAARYASPEFTPHVTLYSCNRSATCEELSLLASLSRQFSPFNMTVRSTRGSGHPAQAFCLDLDRHGDAEELHQVLARKNPGLSAYSFHPHLSLVYQDLLEAEREKLLETWVSPLTTICFDQLWAVAIPARIRRQEDFNGWQPLLICQLDSSLNDGTLLKL